MGVTDNKKRPATVFANRNAMDFGNCEHGVPMLFGRCKECAAERNAKAKAQFMRATEAKATAEVCAKCGRTIQEDEPITVRKVFAGRGYSVAAVCKECANVEKALPCYWCERPVAMDYELFASRNRSGIFCCDRCRSKWHNRRHSAIRKANRQRYLAKTCEVCAKEFTAKRVDTKTCSAACKQKAYRDRGRIEDAT